MQSPSAVHALNDMAESSCRWYWSWFVVELMTPELGYDVFMLRATATAKENAQKSVEIFVKFVKYWGRTTSEPDRHTPR